MKARSLLLCLLLPAAALAQWPNGPNDDPREAYPADPGYIQIDDQGEVTGGQWNLWSFVPESYQKTKGFREEEIALGTGIHADRAWQRTIGDRRVFIAVLDSGINWDARELQMKHYLNKAELGGCKPKQTDPPAADEWDIDGNGIFNIGDYLVADPNFESERDALGNQNGLLDPGDLIRTCSDGVDDDGNGFIDDISGWDAMWNDNDPADDTRYGHGTGEARDSAAAGNDGHGDIGVCPECTVLNVRVGDSFVTDANDFATGVIFAVDSGASVVQEALGTVNNTAYAMAAIEYAHHNNVVIIASAADELSFHHNMPGTNNHTVYVHAIVHDGPKASKSTTFLNYNNCTNHGGQLLLSTPGGGCSSEATGITAGHAGLIYSAGLKAELSPPLSAEEVRGVLIQSVDDIDVPESATDDTKFPSGPGWDMHFGYGRNNARTSVDLVLDDRIPPEADIVHPLWFEPIDVLRRPTIAIEGRVGARVDGHAARYDNYTWELEWALGVDPKGGWEPIASGTGEVGGGMTPALLAEWDVAKAAERIDYDAPLTDAHQYSVTLRLRVTTQHNGEELYNEFRKTAHLIKDETALPGFPKYMGTSVEGSPKMVDIDGDGAEEALLSTTDGYIHAIKADGTNAPGWPAAMPPRKELDEAGAHILDICAFQGGAKAGCATRGSVDPSLGKQTIMTGIAVGALTGDDTDLSVVTATFDGYVLVFDSAGELRPGWPQRTNPEFSAVTSKTMTLDEGFFSAPTLYDLDDDGDLEIIAAAMDQAVYVWHHDGSPMAGWPVVVSDPLEDQRARIIVTPAVGDVDNDGFPEIAVGTNEVYGDIEARGYLLKHTGSPDPNNPLPALEDGWPVIPLGVAVNVLPLVGRGIPTNIILADLDGDGTLELNVDSIGFTPQLWHHDGRPYERDGEILEMNNSDFGSKSNSTDAPAYTLINHGSFGRMDPYGGLDLVKGTAGFDFALSFAEGGKAARFDHQVSAWDTENGRMLEGFPRVMDDWQFFMNPTIVDIDGDDLPEAIAGSGGYLIHAWNYLGEEPAGFPKMTGGWNIQAPTVGDLDGDGDFDLMSATRNGWLFAWDTGGPAWGRIEWQSYAHDHHNTNNYEEPVARYNHYPERPTGTDGTDGTDGADGTDAGDSTDGADGAEGADGASDGTDGLDAPSAPQPGDGCTASPSGQPTGPLALLVVLLLAAVTLRRRQA